MRVVVKTWEELKPLASFVGVYHLSLSNNTNVSKSMDDEFKRRNGVVEVVKYQNSNYQYKCVSFPIYYLTDEMIKRKAYRNDL